jgi:hypothetical protein
VAPECQTPVAESGACPHPEPPDRGATWTASARLNADGSLYVPADPRAVSWASQDMAPGSSSGTISLVGHVNYGGVAGAFSDLADYRVGKVITLVLADGRRLKFAVAARPLEVNKDKRLPRREELFDQMHSYGRPGVPRPADCC